MTTHSMARILILGENQERFLTLSRFFATKGCAAMSGTYDLLTGSVMQEKRPDIILMTFAGAAEGEKACDLCDMLRRDQETAHIPILIDAREISAPLRRRLFALGVDDLLAGESDAEILFARLRPLVRISTMMSELQLRRFAAADLGHQTPPPSLSIPSGETYHVLASGSVDADLELIRGALSDGYKVGHIDDLAAAEKILLDSPHDALIVSLGDERKEIAPTFALCQNLRSNPRFFNLPVLLIANAHALPDEVEPYRNGASNVLYRPLRHDDLQIAILTLVRRQKRRWLLRDHLVGLLNEKTRDVGSDLYNNKFLQSYIARAVGESLQWRKHFSIIRLKIGKMDKIRDELGHKTADILFRKIAEIVISLLRAEDIAARYGRDEIVVLLPGTPAEDVSMITKRLGTGIRDNRLVVPVTAAGASVKGGDSADSLFRRAEIKAR